MGGACNSIYLFVFCSLYVRLQSRWVVFTIFVQSIARNMRRTTEQIEHNWKALRWKRVEKKLRQFPLMQNCRPKRCSPELLHWAIVHVSISKWQSHPQCMLKNWIGFAGSAGAAAAFAGRTQKLQIIIIIVFTQHSDAATSLRRLDTVVCRTNIWKN